MKIKEITVVGLFTALMCVFSIFQLPIGPVPITLQTMMVLMTGAILGARLGPIAMGIYVLLGAIGLPVFSGMTGGIGVLFGYKGGYILGFIGATFIIGCIVDKFYKKGKNEYVKLLVLVIAMLIGTLFIYILGALGLMIALNYSLMEAITGGILPFIIPDLVKLIIAAVVVGVIKGYTSMNYCILS